MDNSGAIYAQLLEQLRETLPEVATQVEEEVTRGRRVVAKTLPAPDRTDREARMREAGSRISKDDLASVPYSDDQRLALLIDALLRLGSSMVTSREALAKFLAERNARPVIRFRREEAPEPSVEIDVAVELLAARGAFDETSAPIREALTELK